MWSQCTKRSKVVSGAAQFRKTQKLRSKARKDVENYENALNLLLPCHWKRGTPRHHRLKTLLAQASKPLEYHERIFENVRRGVCVGGGGGGVGDL
jgi:hypothetical protein